ncbi:hypothetical protein BAUCODRAFT_306249 [Baudoinia panamericana UAMH 10762]|uniref:tripeptidyl-peptidase II n=1 Tax=Baudoinia panamericana (strain UAMH 10762) TaxID=717646 RepID=M2MYT1_BAUPA|nr:uncharacterized protein BAUCODRAFT_306249 [Baudoinia panamericana UAMH 10762]EMC91834.1 hypothetical protein BAUCODRAFT_306249 [Baudoinia panamericana UAMH 10762]
MKFVAILCTAVAVMAAPHTITSRGDFAVKDTHSVPPQWKKLRKAPADHTISLRIGLTQASFSELEKRLFEVSDPANERYGQHLSAEEARNLAKPSAEALSAVHDWLHDSDVRPDTLTYSPSRDWITVALPVAKIEQLLNTEYHVYENDEGTKLVRTPEYSLPRGLHRHIDVIQPTNYFGHPKAMAQTLRVVDADIEPHLDLTPPDYPWHRTKPLSPYSTANLSAVCDESAVTNLCLRTLYRTVDYVPQVPELNSVAMTAYLNETANISDFHVFLSRQRKDASLNYTYNYTTINGGINFQSLETTYYDQRDNEANLDAQTIGGFIYPTDFRVYSTGGSPPYTPDISTPTNTNEPYLEWLAYMLALDSPPHTISTSYGDYEHTVPYSYALRACQELAQLGARGVSVVFSSGDAGVGPNGTCSSNDGTNTPMFLPTFPASCPYVTTVGGTRNLSPEVVAYDVLNDYVSGSGLSNYFQRPSYQNAAVKKYLSSIGSLHAGLYNTSGRAYPDISAQGYHYVVVYAGLNAILDGTSASAPTATSVLTLVNDALIAAGKSPLGFLNPALYSTLYHGFNDITIGNAWGCDTSGFPAGKGWDLASGFGTPDFKKIKGLALAGWAGPH